MNYQVWTKGDYEGYQKKDCPDLEAVQAAILEAVKAGKEPLVTVEVPYEVNIEIKGVTDSAVKKSKAKPGQGPGGESHGEVRRGDETVVEGLDKGSGDNRSGSGAGD